MAFWKLLNKGSKSTRGATLIGLAAAVGQGLSFVLSPVLSRLYDPDDFAVFGVYATIVGVLGVVASGRLEYALPIAKSDTESGALVRLITCGLISVSSVALMTVLIFGPSLSAKLLMPELISSLLLVPVGILAFGVFQAGSYLKLRGQDYLNIAKARGIQGSMYGVAQTAIGAVSGSALGLSLGQVVSHLAGIIILRRDVWSRYFSVPMCSVLSTLIRYKRFPLFAMPAALLNTATLRIPIFFLAGMFGSQAAGSFVFCQSVIGAPVMLVGRTLGQVYIGKIGELRRANSPGIGRVFCRLVLALTVLGSLFGLTLKFGGEELFSFVFGENWRTAGQFVETLAIVFALEIVVIPVTQTLELLERQTSQMIWDGARLTAVCSTFIASTHYSWSVQTTLGTYALVLVAFYLALLLLMRVEVADYDRRSR